MAPTTSWEEYNTHNAADALRGFGNAIDPTYYIAKLFGGKGGISDAVASYYENSLGQPIGHSGKVGIDFNAPHIKDAGLTEDIWKQVYGSLNDQELKALEGMGDNAQLSWIKQRWSDIQSGKLKEQEAAQSKASATDLLREFAQHMMAPIDKNDPYVQQIMNSAAGAAQDDARMRGLNGGYAVANTERNVGAALTAAQLQRNQLGAQAMGQAGQLDLGQARLALDQYNSAYQAQLANLQAQQQNRQAQGAAGGALFGAVGQWAGIPGVNPQSGAAFGGGYASLQGGGAPQLAYQPPSYGMSRPPYGGTNRGSY